LDKPYDLILKSISKDNNVGKAISDNYGLRIMRQDLWQCVISFICSSVSNVPRIRSNIIHLSELFGKKLSNDGYAFHLFPSFDTLCKVDEKDIAKAGMGFRAKYVKEAALWFSEGRHLGLKNLNHSMAREHLMEIKGIGRKIAECICLFSLGFDDAFPVDVWIKREMERMYFKGKSTKIDEIESFGKEYFGRYCGWAQEFLFHNARTRKN
jgi:N-glycosylase/DNA lyase